MVNPLLRPRLRPAVRGPRERPGDPADVIGALQEEITQLRRAIASRAVIDQAIGVVIALEGLAPEQGCEILKDVSQRTNTKLRDLAQQVVEAVQRGRLPAETRRALRAALARARSG